VREQTSKPHEVLVIDDGSSNEEKSANAALIKQFSADNYLHVYNAGNGSGASAVRNIGLAMASGDWIIFCDDDDYWCDPKFLELATRAIADKVDLIFANQRAHNPDGTLAYDVWQPGLLKRIAYKCSEPDQVVALSRTECLAETGTFAHLNTSLFRTSFLRELGGFWPLVRYSEDQDLYVRAIDRASGVRYINRTVSVHSRPNRILKENEQTRTGENEKLLTLVLIANHLTNQCGTAQAQDYARRLGSYACKKLARSAFQAGIYQKAVTWAQVASGWSRSWKWSLYTVYLMLRTARTRA